VQFAYRCCCGVARSVRQGKDPNGPPIDRDEHSRTPGRGEFISTAAQLTQVYAFGRHEPTVANQHSLAVNLCLGPVARKVAERPGDQFGYSGFVGSACDSLSERMF
jgi:hypothetical protein